MTLFNVCSLYPVEPVRGKGCFVYDAAGTEYLDLYGGHAVISIGHAQPDYVKAISEQAARLGFYSNSVETRFRPRWPKAGPRIRVTATTAFSSAIRAPKPMKTHSSWRRFRRAAPKVLRLLQSLPRPHVGRRRRDGQPLHPVAVQRDAQRGIRPAERPRSGPRQARHARNSPPSSSRAFRAFPGIHCPTDEFLRGLRAAATETGTQLVLDEIQSGYGRTGRFFAHQWAGIRPDLITMAKGMGNGFPIGGVLIAPHFEARPGLLGTTFAAAATSPARRPSPCWMSWSARSWSRTPPTRANTCSANCVRPTDRKRSAAAA